MIEHIPINIHEMQSIVYSGLPITVEFDTGGIALAYDTDKPLEPVLVALCELRGVSAPEVAWWRSYKEIAK